jgi:nitrite reductase/ring-hydroxylating ferredoxin subunit
MSDGFTWVRVASADEIVEGEVLPVEVAGRHLAIYRLEDGAFYATDNVCTHAFALLSEGWLEEGVIECPLHNGRFDVRTGKGLCPPIEEDLQTFAVRLDGDQVMVGLPA